MHINKTLENGKLSISLAGRLDTNTSPELESEMDLSGVNEILFDFTDLEYISSAGLRILMAAQKAMIACSGKMTVAHPNAMVKGVFDITGMSGIFNIVQ